MRCLKGKTVSPGYARGIAVHYKNRDDTLVPRYEIEQAAVEDEHERFQQAVKRSYCELKRIEDRLLSELGKSQSAIFSAHLSLLTDKSFANRVKQRISRDLVNVEHALDAEIADLCQLLNSVENEYLREREQDIRDLGSRVMQHLAGRDAARHFDHLPPNSVIVARELFPSETIDLDRTNVVAIVTEQGGENSHAAILARALGIPAVTGVVGATANIPPGSHVLVDGQSGQITITPSDNAEHAFAVAKQAYDDTESAAAAAESLECVTNDGVRISLLANLNRSHEVDSVATHHLDGVGLFRTEFMFMDSLHPPNVKRQSKIYKQAAGVLNGRPLVIRTLDLGGDKLPAFVAAHHEANPTLGLRGLRFSLAERTLFDTQLRAILRVSQGNNNLRVLLPMVVGPNDLENAIEFVREIADEMQIQKVPPIGAMIETPSALFALDEILELADFVSIGTNDLTQFMLAADRNAADLADDYSVLHPCVLRAIAQVAECCQSAERELTVCGEAAGYPRTACLFVGLGIRRLSMSSHRAATVRYALRSANAGELENLAQAALACKSTDRVINLLRA